MNTPAILTGKARKTAYVVYGLLGVALGATQTALAVYGMGDVKWIAASMAVYTFLGGAFGFVAGDNVLTEEVEPLAPPEAVETDLAPEDEAHAQLALVNDQDPTEEPHPYEVPMEVDETPVPEDYQPRH